MIQQNVSLLPYNTFRMDVHAAHFAQFSSAEQLQQLLDTRISGMTGNRLILGGGSNVLLMQDFNGLVLRNGIRGIECIGEDEDYFYVKAGGGEVWHELVEFCIARNYMGLENLSLIPGTAGAAPMQNIGAYGVELKDVFHELEAFHIRERRIQRFSAADCGFGYRESVFKKQYKDEFVILNVSFRLRRKPIFIISYGAIREELEKMQVQDLSVRAVSDAVIRIRQSKLPDPVQLPNAGSFFKNPLVSRFRWRNIHENHPDVVAHWVDELHYKLAAGWLIEKCGWKGVRRGDAGCHEKQALVLVNYGHASGRDIYDLSEEIISSVREKFGVTLEREVNIVGAGG